MADLIDNIDAKQLDVFTEIGNIGAGNAATALAGILNRRINMSIPKAEVVPFKTVTNILGGPEAIVAGVLVNMSGDLNGYILLILEMKDAIAMVSLASGEHVTPPSDKAQTTLTEYETDAVLEISNIIVGSFLSAISSITSLKIIPYVPQLAIDMLGAIISIPAIEYGKMGDSVLFLKTEFEDDEKEMSGHFFLIPDYKSYKILIESLGL